MRRLLIKHSEHVKGEVLEKGITQITIFPTVNQVHD